MENKVEVSKKPIILGVVSMVMWLVPIIGLITSGFGIAISSKKSKEYQCKSYKIGYILNVIGMILTIINFVVGMYLVYKQMY